MEPQKLPVRELKGRCDLQPVKNQGTVQKLIPRDTHLLVHGAAEQREHKRAQQANGNMEKSL